MLFKATLSGAPIIIGSALKARAVSLPFSIFARVSTIFLISKSVLFSRIISKDFSARASTLRLIGKEKSGSEVIFSAGESSLLGKRITKRSASAEGE